jgi:hypothetical protein
VLRRSLKAKNAETGREAVRKKAELEQSVRAAIAEETWSKRAGELFRAGNYSELTRVLAQWSQTNPGSSEAGDLRARSAAVQQQVAAFQASLGERRYAEAAIALARSESLNPSDPALPEMRRMLESKRDAAKARLTVLRLSDPGVVLLDSVPIGHGGEVHGAAIGIGEHVLSIKLPGTAVLTASYDFAEGENASFVYDATALRPMNASDLEAASSRKAREQTHKFFVEHPHGLLRGSCRGELLVNGFDVRYVPESGSHGFQIPLSRLRLRTEGRAVELRFASDDAAFQAFRIRDVSDSESLRQIWSKLQTGTRSR